MIDESELVNIGEFAIFDEDDNFDESKLDEIISVNNARIEDTGELIPVICGHTRDDAKETEQPIIVGWATKLRKAMIGNLAPRKAIMASFKILKSCLETVKNYPRRSIELWENDLIIDPIALLGASRPAKNLGLMTFSQSKTGTRITKYFEQEDKKMAEISLDKDALVKLIQDEIMNSEVGQYVITKMKQPEQESMAAAVEEKAVAEEEAGEPIDEETKKEMEAKDAAESPEEEAAESPEYQAAEEEAGVEKHEPEAKADLVSDEEKDKEKYCAGVCKECAGKGCKFCEGAGGSNTSIPEPLKVKHEADGEVSKFEAEVIFRYKKENDELKLKLQALDGEVRKYSRERALVGLAQEFAFDVNDEMRMVSDFSDEQFNRHLTLIRTRYSKFPVNRGVEVHPVKSAEGALMAEPINREKVEKAIKFAQLERCSFEEALKRV